MTDGAPPESSETGPLVVILGPTASGKTALAVEIGRRLNAEAINADSRQVYRSMDIGTAKPTAEERAVLPHHLLDLVEPDEPFSLGEYLRLARAAIEDVRARGRIPLLVGGSPQYVWALVEGWEVPAVEPDLALRQRLEQRARAEGAISLHAELARLDPAAAQAIHPNNVRRVIRALELWSRGGQRPSAARRKRTPRSDALILGLQLDRAALYARIDRRVDWMFHAGLVPEVERLLARGFAPSLPSMSAIGYTQVVQALRGELTLADATARVKTASHRFARQQSTWFRSDDPRIFWLAPGDVDAALARIRMWPPAGALATGVIR
jgi:tRNA dimethylallyltransferase